jgi:hypothetical protein
VVSYLRQKRMHKKAFSAELLSLFIVLAAGAATFWYGGRQIGVDLSSVTAIASILGLTQGVVRADAPTTTQLEAVAVPTLPPSAPVCSPDQPIFVHGMAALKEQLGDVMGVPLECEHPADSPGDTVQQTSTGLAFYTAATNLVTFTDGWNHWALDPTGDLLSWQGTQAEPPRG